MANRNYVTLECTIEGCTDSTVGTWQTRSNIPTDGTKEIKESRSVTNDRTNTLTTFLTFYSARTFNSGTYSYSLHGIKSEDIELNVIESKFFNHLSVS